MKAARVAAVGIGSGLGLICLFNLWALATRPGTSSGELSITLSGWTNNAPGEVQVLFNISNSFAHRVQFGVGELQFREPGGWPPLSRLGAGTGDWLSVEAGSNLVFSVPAPPPEEPPWRVPIIYECRPPSILELPRRVINLDLGIARWRVRTGANPRLSFAVGPEMVGSSNVTARIPGNSHSASR